MCVCVRGVYVCVNTKPFSSPLDITVSSLISGLFEDCEKLDWTNYCVAHIMDHAGILKKGVLRIALMFNPLSL